METINLIEETIKSSLPAPWLENYKWAMSNGNPHAKTFPLMNPFHAILVAIAYLVIISVGKAVMRNVKKFEMQWFSLLHNLSMVLLNGYACVEIIRQSQIGNYTLFGNGVDASANGLPMARVLWLFYFLKPVEFIDTFIMVLKKNNHQVSFLHVYHHIATFLIWWGVIYYAPGGDTYFSAAQNCFIHVLMYGYYFLASLKINAPWKKYLTQAQMFQFVLNMVQACYVLYYPTPYPRTLAMVLLSYMVTLLFLFGNFYVKGNRRTESAEPKQKKVQ